MKIKLKVVRTDWAVSAEVDGEDKLIGRIESVSVLTEEYAAYHFSDDLFFPKYLGLYNTRAEAERAIVNEAMAETGTDGD